jgi:predicted permease
LIVILCLLAGVIGLFLAIAFVCPRIPAAGEVDLWQFHLDNRRKYLAPALAAFFIATVISLCYDDVQNMPNQNLQAAIFACMIIAGLAAFFSSNATVQRLAAMAYFAGGVLFFVVGDPVLVST